MQTKLVTVFISVQLWALGVAVPTNAGALPVPQAANQDQSGITTIPVLALDHHGRPVTDLNQSELKLLEGKEELTIESLSRSSDSPRRVGFLVDNGRRVEISRLRLNIQDDTELADEVLRGEDTGFVAVFALDRSLICSPTSDVRTVDKGLRLALRAQAGGGGSSLHDAIYWASGSDATTHPGRKVLIILSDMIDPSSQHTAEEAVNQALRSGTVIYPIMLGKLIPWAERVTRSLAEETGGAYFTPITLGDLRAAMRKIRSYLDNSYVLRYRPRSPGPVAIKIRCTRKGVKIVAPDRRY